MSIPVPPADTPTYRRTLALQGFREAVLRFRGRAEEGDFHVDPYAIMMPLVEALWWAVSADEEIEHQAGSAYRSTRNTDPNGRVFLGIIYARNRCGHQRALAPKDHSFRLGISILGDPDTVLGPAIKWRPLNELPPPDPKYQNLQLAREYDQHLASELVDATLGRVEAWFVEAERRWP